MFKSFFIRRIFLYSVRDIKLQIGMLCSCFTLLFTLLILYLIILLKIEGLNKVQPNIDIGLQEKYRSLVWSRTPSSIDDDISSKKKEKNSCYRFIFKYENNQNRDHIGLSSKFGWSTSGNNSDLVLVHVINSHISSIWKEVCRSTIAT